MSERSKLETVSTNRDCIRSVDFELSDIWLKMAKMVELFKPCQHRVTKVLT